MTQQRVMRPAETVKESRAFRSGWEDGRFGGYGSFADNSSLATWQEYEERLAYYRGHREGRRVRDMLRLVVAEGA